jgi:hypothetical protein
LAAFGWFCTWFTDKTRTIASVLLLLLITAGAHAQSHKIPFTLRDGQPLLTLSIDGKPVRMLLDTGSNVTIVRKLIGSVGPALKLRSANGSSLAHNCEISVEGVRLNGLCGASYLPDFEDGIVGTDFLKRFGRVVIDFTHCEIELAPLGQEN